ncbi:hypothetical protein [Acidisoma sp. 7E03]
MRRFLQKWDFFSAALLAAAGAYFLPHNAMKDITTELIAFFSIQSAVILPAMIFTAGILKPDGLELEDATRYHKALKAQMLFWVALLSLDFVAVVALIAGKALNWSLVLPMPANFKPFDLGWLLPAILYFSGSLAIFRTIPFVRGVLSLLDVNSDMTLKAITRRNRIENAERKAQADPTPMALPEGYGKVVKPEDD